MEPNIQNVQSSPSELTLQNALLQQMKKQLTWTRVCAIVCAAVLVLFLTVTAAAGIIINDVSADLNEYAGSIGNIDVIIEKMDTITDDLGKISTQLAKIDWIDLSENISETATVAQESMVQAMNAVDELDIETLNKAIADLEAVVEPLAALVNAFK